MYFKAIYILILLFTIVIDYFAGIYIEKTLGNKRKLLLIISLVANIGILVFYKYFNFLNQNLGSLFSLIDVKYSVTNISFLLPIGLSFHTFQAMSYTIEIYRGKQKAEKKFGIYALYVLFWPQLVAGPIERPQNILHQFYINRSFSISNFKIGLRLILWGLFKKVVIADTIALIINNSYDLHSIESSSVSSVIAMYLFSIQIYCDFSGYSDIAIGTAKTMGFDLMKNFNNPYFAKNITEFWRRWHISLSTWFKDYLYIPLGGSKQGKLKLFRNILIVFLISGLWHGANWNFIIWGAIHGVLQVIFLIFSKLYFFQQLKKNKLTSFFSIIFTFHLVSFAWIFFRAENFDISMKMIQSIFHFFFEYRLASIFIVMKELINVLNPIYLLLVIGMFIYEYRVNFSKEKISTNKLFIELTVLTFIIILMGTSVQESFIYFQF